MEKWEYNILEFKSSGLLSGDTNILTLVDYEESISFLTGRKVEKPVEKKISIEEIEGLFDDLGEEGWELIGILPLTGRTGFGEPETKRVFFIFKRNLEN